MRTITLNQCIAPTLEFMTDYGQAAIIRNDQGGAADYFVNI